MVLHVVGLGPNLTNIVRLLSALHSLRPVPAHDSNTTDLFDKKPNQANNSTWSRLVYGRPNLQQLGSHFFPC